MGLILVFTVLVISMMLVILIPMYSNEDASTLLHLAATAEGKNNRCVPAQHREQVERDKKGEREICSIVEQYNELSIVTTHYILLYSRYLKDIHALMMRRNEKET